MEDHLQESTCVQPLHLLKAPPSNDLSPFRQGLAHTGLDLQRRRSPARLAATADLPPEMR
ncbi:hypothetical protein CCHL11_09901 [Colletotrichum chlorophyti]|uniref:Uncharacterized protein n=1 Tax=Colletotrichum chlorophyti TaxID=708187 RepID=A0A1Q8RDA3_9PEZI|nr:hypothetical protein CCHL11_09901 [Colletotrichum chlorophyti]